MLFWIINSKRKEVKLFITLIIEIIEWIVALIETLQVINSSIIDSRIKNYVKNSEISLKLFDHNLSIKDSVLFPKSPKNLIYNSNKLIKNAVNVSKCLTSF